MPRRTKTGSAAFGRATAAFVALALLSLSSRRALAFPTARLEYERGPGTEACPDQPALVRAVAERLGYDPFDPAATQALHARLDAGAQGFSAVIELRDSAGQIVAERRLSSAGSCAEVAQAMALSMSIVIDPERALERSPGANGESSSGAAVSAPAAPPATSAPAEQAPPAPSSAAPPPSRERSSRPVAAGSPESVGQLTASTHLSLGLEPGATIGLSVGAGARRGPLSFVLEGRYDAPGSRALEAGELSAEFFGLAAVPCFHRAPIAACALGMVGFLRAESRGVADARSDAGFFAGSGARLALEWPLLPHLSLTARGDLLLSLRRLAVERNGSMAWESPLLTGLLAGGFVAAF